LTAAAPRWSWQHFCHFVVAAGLEQEVQQLKLEKNQLMKYVDILVKKCNEQFTARRA
jgi:hypothetical protein